MSDFKPKEFPDLKPNELVLFMQANNGRLDFHCQLPKKENKELPATQEEHVLQCLAIGVMALLGQSSKDVIKAGHDILTAQRVQNTIRVADPDPDNSGDYQKIIESIANG